HVIVELWMTWLSSFPIQGTDVHIPREAAGGVINHHLLVITHGQRLHLAPGGAAVFRAVEEQSELPFLTLAEAHKVSGPRPPPCHHGVAAAERLEFRVAHALPAVPAVAAAEPNRFPRSMPAGGLLTIQRERSARQDATAEHIHRIGRIHGKHEFRDDPVRLGTHQNVRAYDYLHLIVRGDLRAAEHDGRAHQRDGGDYSELHGHSPVPAVRSAPSPGRAHSARQQPSNVRMTIVARTAWTAVHPADTSR